ncbi:hypothetical protein [Microbulbifer sp. JMSA003]|uniref:hypothetical protein n=1 Tax=Microbulbifer sp. JMSA003 TaxID=3243369 RepID=UPI00403A4961
MSINADWAYWTYILVDGNVATRGCILELNLEKKWIKYSKETGNSPQDNPFKKGDPRRSEWYLETCEGTYKEIWVDPKKSLILSREEFRAIESGIKPESFIFLNDTDPRAYFESEIQVVSTRVPPKK